MASDPSRTEPEDSAPDSDGPTEKDELPMEREPGAVFGVVAGSYLIILIVALLVIAGVIWAMI